MLFFRHRIYIPLKTIVISVSFEFSGEILKLLNIGRIFKKKTLGFMKAVET